MCKKERWKTLRERPPQTSPKKKTSATVKPKEKTNQSRLKGGKKPFEKKEKFWCSKENFEKPSSQEGKSHPRAKGS